MRGGTIRVGARDYITFSTPASGMPTNREAKADAYAAVKPRIAFAPICNRKGEHIAAEVDSTSLGRASITGGGIDKSGNRKSTWNGSREAADESRSFHSPKGEQQMKTNLDTMNHAQRAAFARSLYHRPVLKINAATSVTKFTIRRCA